MGDIFNPSRVFIVHSLFLKTVEKQTKLHTTNQKKKKEIVKILILRGGCYYDFVIIFYFRECKTKVKREIVNY
jgi:hypothetical protein